MQANIRRVPVDAFSAMDVLEQREAECQGHAYLYAALTRSLGIPTRVVNGLVYSEAVQGFLYHSWAESYLTDGWYAVDPTFGQPAADATHLKLIEGESIADLLPLLDWVGNVRIDVLEQG
jgi:transglutaminase/protease-like cytokinesis protein 3